MLEDTPLREQEIRLLVNRFYSATKAQGAGVTPDDFVKALLATREV